MITNVSILDYFKVNMFLEIFDNHCSNISLLKLSAVNKDFHSNFNLFQRLGCEKDVSITILKYLLSEWIQQKSLRCDDFYVTHLMIPPQHPVITIQYKMADASVSDVGFLYPHKYQKTDNYILIPIGRRHITRIWFNRYFARALRAAGIPVGPGAVLDALEAVKAAGVGTRDDFYWTLHAVFVKRHEHSVLFDQAFRIFFRRRGYIDQLMAMMLPQAPNRRSRPRPAPRACTRLCSPASTTSSRKSARSSSTRA